MPQPSARAIFPAILAILLLIALAPLATAQLELRLPTQNDAIFSSDPSKFYMYTYRHFEGVDSKPWSGGRFGFVRNQRRTSSGIVFTKFHEGLDIRTISRDAAGKPSDNVRAIMPGTVVYVNSSASASSYGKYIVVVHEGSFYSLYAHLNATAAKKGQVVKAGDLLGKLGYTGAGINNERAHLHLELALLMNDRFETWYGKHFTSKNNHGIYSGFNLTGMDVAGLYHAHRANPAITIPEFIATAAPYYKVTVQNRGELALVKRYPWLKKTNGKGPSWEITFEKSGLPLEVKASSKAVTYPAVTWVKDSPTNHSYHTQKRISGSGAKATLTGSGSRYTQLMTGAF
ncbi:MAG: M23 family metallopeptidase [Verrucomicrobiales bacterium]